MSGLIRTVRGSATLLKKRDNRGYNFFGFGHKQKMPCAGE